MSDNGFPSLTALLGLLAVAGYQNRDKIGEWLGGMQGGGGAMNPGGALPSGTGAPAGGPGYLPQGGQGGGSAMDNILAGMRGRNADPGSFIGGAIGNLVDRFKQIGQGDVAQSWVNQGPNQQIAPPDLERAIGPGTMSELTRQTGLSREEILSRLSRELPNAVDRYTPDGRMPAY